MEIAFIEVLALIAYIVIGCVAAALIKRSIIKSGLYDPIKDDTVITITAMFWPIGVPFILIVGYTALFHRWIDKKINSVKPTPIKIVDNGNHIDDTF